VPTAAVGLVLVTTVPTAAVGLVLVTNGLLLVRTAALCGKFVNPHFHLFGYQCGRSLAATCKVCRKVTLSCD
jgi:hypothetical protein